MDRTAQVNWRGVCEQPPSYFEVGSRSIVLARIRSDRDGSRVVIGRSTFVGDSIIVSAAEIRIGDDVLISWGCTIVDHDSHSLDWASRRHDVADFYAGRKRWDSVPVKSVTIGNKAWIGFNVIILKGVQIGEGAVVAAGSVVTHDVAPFSLVAGTPARLIRNLPVPPT